MNVSTYKTYNYKVVSRAIKAWHSNALEQGGREKQERKEFAERNLNRKDHRRSGMSSCSKILV